MKISLLLFLVSFNVWSLDCAGIPEGTVVRIDQGNGSLAKAAIQDQDGIGSCYANQAALILQSILPNNPNLSYLSLGLLYTQKVSLEESRKGGNKFYTVERKIGVDKPIDEGNSALNGGFACGIIDALKEKQQSTKIGGICKVEDVSLEHDFFDPKITGYADPTQKQAGTLLAASKYMNAYQHKFGFAYDAANDSNKTDYLSKRKKADEFRSALTNFVKNNADKYLIQKCTKPNPEKIDGIINNSLTRAFLNSKDCYNNRLIIQTNKPLCKVFEDIGFSFGRSPSAEKPMAIYYELDAPIKKKISNDINSFFTGNPDYEKFINQIETSFKNLDPVKSTSEQKEKFAKAILDNMSAEDKNSLKDEYNRVVLKQVDGCMKEHAIDFFKDKDEFVKAALQDQVLCKYGDLLERASDIAGVIPVKAFMNMSNFLSFLTDKAGLDYDKGLLDFMARDCTPEKRIKIPATMTCERASMSFEPADFPTATGVSDKAKLVIQENRKKLFDNLKANRAVGLDICTAFWKNASYDYHRDNPETKSTTCSNSGEHGFHAITMTGYRCQNNRIQYLAQNSWGPNWELPGGGYEMEMGKIWMDEDKLFKNLQGINYVTP